MYNEWPGRCVPSSHGAPQFLFETFQIQVDLDQKYEAFPIVIQTPLRLSSIDSFSAA